VRRIAAAALLVAPALLLTACGSSGKKTASDAATPSASASPSTPAVPAAVDSASPMPAVGGAFGKSATLTIPTGQKPSDKFVVHTVTQGSGPTVGASDYATAQILVKDWTSGKTLSPYTTATPQLLNPQSQLIPAIEKAVRGHKVGSRVLVVAPPAAAAADMASGNSMGVKKTDTLALVVDVTDRVGANDAVSGSQQSVPSDMPQVTASAGKAASFTVPAAARTAKKLKTAVLVKGSGHKITAGEDAVVQYTGALLSNGKVFDSSWSHGGATCFSTASGQSGACTSVIPGMANGLVGQTVGSRVVISIPSAQGYGATPPSGSNIPKNADLTFVVDILAAD
jgi:peptidylprolyl isomerase